MAVDFEAVKERARRYADDVRKELPVDRVILFGSYAKGTADAKSDVDVCFFLRDYGSLGRFNTILRLMEICFNYHYQDFFEPTAYKTSEIENDNPFDNEVLRTGIDI